MKKRYHYIQFLFLVWVAFLLLPIFIGKNDFIPLLRATQFSAICHQLLDRFFSFNNEFPVVCARCMGIYIGLFIVSYIRIASLNKYLYLFFLPIIIDKVLESFFDVPISNVIRFISGIFFSIPFIYWIQAYFKQKTIKT